jgi:ribosome-associated protein
MRATSGARAHGGSAISDAHEDPAGIVLHDGRVIPPGELRFRASRASGPGGQHVNKTSSRVELRWQLAQSRVVTDAERATIAAALTGRTDADGSIIVVSSETRSQWRNWALAESRLADLIRRALTPRKKRIATAPSVGQREKRLRAKRARAKVKATRRAHDDE